VSDVDGMPDALGDQTFDVVYASRGVLGWLPDIDRWAEVIAARVAAGGIFYLHEVHPVVQTIAEEQAVPNPLTLAFDYWGGQTLAFPVEGWELPWLADLGDGRWGFPPEQRGTIPLMWSLRARRDA
jgi:SAM-dependent methyltransferase